MSWGGVSKQIAVIAAALLVASTAIAQVIPPSEQPGRERERFTQPPAPQAQPGPGAISLAASVPTAIARATFDPIARQPNRMGLRRT